MSEHVETNPRSYVYTSFSNTFLRQMQTMAEVKLSITRGHGNDIRYCSHLLGLWTGSFKLS